MYRDIVQIQDYGCPCLLARHHQRKALACAVEPHSAQVMITAVHLGQQKRRDEHSVHVYGMDMLGGLLHAHTLQTSATVEQLQLRIAFRLQIN